MFLINLSDRKFAVTSLYSFFIKIINAILVLLCGITIARLLGPENYGIYSLCMAAIMIISIPISAGTSNFFVREVAKLKIIKDKNNIIKIIKLYHILALLYTAVIFLLFCLINSILPNLFNNYNECIYSIILILLLPLLSTQNATIRGFGKVIAGQIPLNIASPILFLILLIIFSRTSSPENAILLKIFSSVLAYIIGIYLIYISLKEIKNSTEFYNYEIKYKSLLALTFIGGSQIIIENIDTIILGYFESNTDVGIYKVCFQMSSIVSFGLFSINQIMHPQLAKFYANKNHDEMQKMVRLSSMIILSIALPLVLILIFGGEWILKELFGPTYAAGKNILIILSISQLINASFGSVGALLNMTSNEQYTIKGMMIALFLEILCCVILIPLHGVIGAALSSLIATFSWNFSLRKFVKSRINIEPCCWIKQ